MARWKAVSVLAAPAALFLANFGWSVGHRTQEDLFLHWRAYDDVALATGYAARGLFPVAPYRVRDFVRRERDPRFVAFKAKLLHDAAAADVRPMAFWRTVRARSLSNDRRWLLSKRFDDNGRALLLGLAFRGMGGTAPYLLFWLAGLLFLPIMSWTAAELAAAGYRCAGFVFAAILGASAFVVDVLALGYSAAGFHLAALLTVVAVGVYVVLGSPTVRGVLLRCALAGAVFGVCGVCRGTTPFIFLGVLAVAVLGGRRAALSGTGRLDGGGARFLVGAAALILFIAPWPVLRSLTQDLVVRTRAVYGWGPEAQFHDPALLVWKGLGDFDRSKGYAFRDKAGEQAIRRANAGLHAERHGEIHLRQIILGDIRTDPAWYAAILAKRFLSTLVLYKLWPWAPRDGVSIFSAESHNEGVIDNYYRLTSQADWFRVGSWQGEAPISLLLAPLAAFLVAAFDPRPSRGLQPLVEAARRSVPLLGALILAVLPSPVMITTATALEPQFIVVVYFLALALLVDGLWRSRDAGRAQFQARHSSS